MNYEKYLEWYNKFDEIEKLKIISKKTLELKNYSIRREKALKAELDYGFNRVGVRGGKFTTLYSRSQRITELYLQSKEELKFLIKHL